GVEDAVDVVAFDVRAEHVTRRAVGVDVVGAVLGVVFDDEDGHFGPEFTVAGGFDDAADGEVVAGDAGIRRVGAGGRAFSVIFAERHDGEARELLAGLFGSLEVVDPEVDLVHVARGEGGGPAAAVGGGDALAALAVVA